MEKLDVYGFLDYIGLDIENNIHIIMKRNGSQIPLAILKILKNLEGKDIVFSIREFKK